MKYFTEIEEGQAIIHKGGVYRQVPLFVRDDNIYAKMGGGYVRLSNGGATSDQKTRWAEIDTPHGVHAERGHLVKYTPMHSNVEAAE